MFKLLGQGGQGAALAGILLGLVQKDKFPLVVYHYTLLAECLSSRFFSRGVEFLARRALKVSVKPFQRLAGPGQSPGRSRRSETPQDDYHNGRACVFGTGPAVLL